MYNDSKLNPSTADVNFLKPASTDPGTLSMSFKDELKQREQFRYACSDGRDDFYSWKFYVKDPPNACDINSCQMDDSPRCQESVQVTIQCTSFPDLEGLIQDDVDQGHILRPQTRRRITTGAVGLKIRAFEFDEAEQVHDLHKFQSERGSSFDTSMLKPQTFACQLCTMSGHVAPECDRFLQLRRPKVQCSSCFRMGHSTEKCRSHLQCSCCGKIGHESDLCYSNPNSASYRGWERASPRGTEFQGCSRGYDHNSYSNLPQRRHDRRCYECREYGHLAKDCTLPLRRGVRQPTSHGGPRKHGQWLEMAQLGHGKACNVGVGRPEMGLEKSVLRSSEKKLGERPDRV